MNDDFNNVNSEIWSNHIEYEDLLEMSYAEDIEYLHKNNDKIVVLDKKNNKKVVITRETIGDIEALMRLNPNLKILNKDGYKIGDYIELYLNQCSYDFVNKEIIFYIDEVEVTIRSATDMFILLTDIKYGYDTYIDKYSITISLKGISEHNYDDYYNQCLFMISMISQNYCYLNNKDKYCIEINELINCHYINKNYNEVFYFYNEAMRIYDSEISCLYLYKILEYFFLIIRKNEFEIIINNYNKNKSIDKLMKKITKIYRDDELLQLTILINSIKGELEDILHKGNKINILDSYDINSFAKKLYLYRNSIVHGKSDHKFELSIPNPLYESKKDLFWKDSLRHISEILLFKYCIEKID